MKWTTPFRNKHFPLPLPGTHHFFPSPRKNPLRCHIGKWEDPRDKPWNWGGSSPLFAAIIVMMANFCGTCGENLGQIFKKNQYFLVTSSLHLLTCGKIPLHFQYTYPTHQRQAHHRIVLLSLWILVLHHFLVLQQGQPRGQHRGLDVLQFLPGEMP